MCEIQPWMKLLDERILERLAEHGDAAAWEISVDLSMTASTERVRERCYVLADAEFVDPYPHRIGRDRYETRFTITDRGRAYLDGEVTDFLIQPLPAPRPPHARRPDWWAAPE